jgi:hypothetical protein
VVKPDIEIFESEGVLLLWVLGALILSAYSVGVLAGIAPPPPERGEWATYAGAVLFPLISVALAIRIARSRTPVVILSEAGIKYRFFSSEIVPWAAVLGVEEPRGDDVAMGVRLKLDPEFAKQVPRRGVSRIVPRATPADDVVDVLATGTGRDELYRLIYAFWDSRRDLKGFD